MMNGGIKASGIARTSDVIKASVYGVAPLRKTPLPISGFSSSNFGGLLFQSGKTNIPNTDFLGLERKEPVIW